MVLIFTASAMAEWKAANSEVAAAAKEPKIASVLEAVNAIDAALIKDDHGAFAALLAKDLVVNNPQNSISIRGATGRRNTSGLISYSRYVRSSRIRGDAWRDGIADGRRKGSAEGRFSTGWKRGPAEVYRCVEDGGWLLGVDRSPGDDCRTLRVIYLRFV